MYPSGTVPGQGLDGYPSGRTRRVAAEIRPMPQVEVSRTLVKSPPELWEELQGERLREAVGAGKVTPSEDERLIIWEGEASKGTATLEPSGWGTKVTLRAEIQDQVAELEPEVAKVGLWARLRGIEPRAPQPAPPRHEHLERTLEQLLDDLGSAHRKPFQAN
jgi:hypothetical protein